MIQSISKKRQLRELLLDGGLVDHSAPPSYFLYSTQFSLSNVKRQERAKMRPARCVDARRMLACSCTSIKNMVYWESRNPSSLRFSGYFASMLRFEGLKYRKHFYASIPCFTPKSRAESNRRWNQSFPRNTVPDEQVTRYFLFPGIYSSRLLQKCHPPGASLDYRGAIEPLYSQ